MIAREYIENNISSHLDMIKRLEQVKNLIARLNLLDQDMDICYWSNRIVLGTTADQVHTVAREFLKFVTKFEKSLDAEQGIMSLSGKIKDSDYTLVINYTAPPTCTIEKIAEEIEVAEVPAIPAHKEIKYRYVAKGDCAPILGQESE